jgi:hypothetical protein
MPKLVTFKKGDRVQWTAAGRGGSHIITGEIVSVVNPGTLPKDTTGVVRPHKSYLVKDASGRIYWPRVASVKAEAPHGA